MPGMTAWVGLKVADVEPGDVVYVSGAGGAVGNMVGQLAKLRGCRVIGSAGSDDKVRMLKEDLGFDVAFNYKTAPIRQQLKLAASDGIDIYFDNVGGETLEAALSVMRLHGCIIACGSIANNNAIGLVPGPTNLFNMITRRLTMKGIMVRDWLDHQGDFEKEVTASLLSGKLKHKETVVDGIEQAVTAFIGLFNGNNVGKMVVKVT
jgi:NADPH-dependent curcumin reductase CurA